MISNLQYRLLRKISPNEPQIMDGSAYAGKSKLRSMLGDDLLALVRDKTVIDFGCGEGLEAIELVHTHGVNRVIGIDIRTKVLDAARKHAEAAGLSDRCEFSTKTETLAELIVSLDAFEHFDNPAGVLETMHTLLKPGGCVIASFGPTWYHPLGGHLFSVFPWAHLVFSEEALIRWRSHIRSDRASRFSEVEGGLNQMTIARFERLVSASRFRLETLQLVPIRRLPHLH